MNQIYLPSPMEPSNVLSTLSGLFQEKDNNVNPVMEDSAIRVGQDTAILLFDCNWDDIPDRAFMIINNDIPLEIPVHHRLPAITYGLNAKSTLTASSITDEDFVACIQRNIEDINGALISPQEFTVKQGRGDLYTMLASLCVALLCFGEKII